MADTLSDAKKLLAHANKTFPTSMAKAAGVNPPAPKPAMPAPKPVAVGNPEGNIGKEIQDKIQNVQQVAPTMPKMHKGGKTTKEEPVLLDKNETVRTEDQENAVQDKLKEKKEQPLTDKAMTKDEPKGPVAEKAPKAGKKSSKTKHKHTHIEHHYDEAGKAKGHTVRHVPMGGGEETSYAAPDLDAVHDGLEEHLGEPEAPMAGGPAGPAGPMAAGGPEPAPAPVAPPVAAKPGI